MSSRTMSRSSSSNGADQPQRYYIRPEESHLEVTVVPKDQHYWGRLKAAKKLGVTMDKLNDEPDTEPDNYDKFKEGEH